MLPDTPWRTEAIARLLASVFLCIIAGSLVASVLHHVQAPGAPSPRVLAPGAGAFVLLAVALLAIIKPWVFESFMRRLAIVVVSFYGGLFLWIWAMRGAGTPGLSVGHMVIAALSFQGGTLLLLIGFLREHRLTWSDAFGLKRESLPALLKGVILASLFLPLGWALQYGSIELLERLPGSLNGGAEQQAVTTLRLASSWADRLVLGAVTILLAPLAEEFLFRGVLYSWIRQLGFPRIALWVTSVVFAAFHLNAATFLPLLVLALLLAQLYERTGNLLAPIIAHSLFNAFNFTAIFIVEKLSPAS